MLGGGAVLVLGCPLTAFKSFEGLQGAVMLSWGCILVSARSVLTKKASVASSLAILA